MRELREVTNIGWYGKIWNIETVYCANLQGIAYLILIARNLRWSRRELDER